MPTVNRDIQAVTFLSGIALGHAVNNVTDALPTQAEMVTALGAAAAAAPTPASTALRVIKDANADTNLFLCLSNGTSWYALKFTKGA